MMQAKAQVEPRNVSMYSWDWVVVISAAKDQGLASISAGLRWIIRDWQRLKRMEAGWQQYLRLENAYRLNVITQDEFVSGLGLVAVMARNGGDDEGD